ncbi:MAG: hypothetical protein KBG28_05800 [Kofleriaceae bacterium]|nr:hypothetical protein [Kofleriaceae bacterium]
MKALLVCATVVLLALGWLWREVTTAPEPSAAATATVEAGAGRGGAPAGPALAAPSPAPAMPPGELPTPPGGIRTWSPTAAPIGGPDPYAPAAQVRTAEDTRAGLPD